MSNIVKISLSVETKDHTRFFLKDKFGFPNGDLISKNRQICYIYSPIGSLLSRRAKFGELLFSFVHLYACHRDKVFT